MKPSIRTIADSIEIGTEWTSIRPDPPLEVEKRIQRISIGVADVADWGVDYGAGTFVMPDGTAIELEVVLEAEDGSRFVLDSIGLGPGLTFSYLPEDASERKSRLPPDARFPLVRVRADKPLNAGPVEWICITNY